MKDCRIFSAVFFFDTRSDAIHPSGFCSAELELGGFGVPFFGITLAPYKFGIGGSVNQNSLRSFLEIGSGLLRLTMLFIILIAAVGFLNPAYAAKSDFWCRAPGGASYEYNCGRVDFWTDMGYGSSETKSSCERRFKSVCGNPTPVRSGGNTRSPANLENTNTKPKKSRKPVVEAPAADDGGGPEVVAAPAPIKAKKPVPAAPTPAADETSPAAADAGETPEGEDAKGPPAKPAKVAGEPEAGPVAPVAAEAAAPAAAVPAKVAPKTPAAAAVKAAVNPNMAPKPVPGDKKCVTNAKELKASGNRILLNNLRGLMKVNFDLGSRYILPLSGTRLKADESCYGIISGLKGCQDWVPIQNVKFRIDGSGNFMTESPNGPLKIDSVCSDGTKIEMNGVVKNFPFKTVMSFSGENISAKTTVQDGRQSVEVARLTSTGAKIAKESGAVGQILEPHSATGRAVASVAVEEEEAR